jgi:chaperone required for assembly of F1-ATPase
MPLTGLANAAIDLVADDPGATAADCAAYAASDLLCYRADGPPSLVARQAEMWEPWIAWAEARFDVRFVRTTGVAPVTQPADTLARIRTACAACPPFALAPLMSLVRLSGSAILPLALLEGAVAPQAAWEAAILDEAWQAERFGDDREAAAARADRQAAFLAAARFLALATEPMRGARKGRA